MWIYWTQWHLPNFTKRCIFRWNGVNFTQRADIFGFDSLWILMGISYQIRGKEVYIWLLVFPIELRSDPYITKRYWTLVFVHILPYTLRCVQHEPMCCVAIGFDNYYDSFHDQDWRWSRTELLFDPTIYLFNPTNHIVISQTTAVQRVIFLLQDISRFTRLGVQE